MFLGQGFKVLLIINFLTRASPVPKAHFACGGLGFKEMGQMGSQWCHASPAADVDHLALCGLDVKIAKGPDGGQFISGLE